MSKEIDKIKKEILSKVNIRAEMETVGIQFSSNTVSPAGWMPCFNPYTPEKNASAGVNVTSGSDTAGYLVTFNMLNGKKPQKAYSFFDIMADFKKGMGGDFKRTLKFFADQTGVKFLYKANEVPTQKMVDKFRGNLIPEVRKYLNEKRGFSDETIEKFQIGWDTKRERNSYPVYDKEGELVNIRFHNSKKKPKTMSMTGYGKARLFNVAAISKENPNDTVFLTEGECFEAKETEVLTPEGWVFLDKYKHQDVMQVYQNKTASFVKPIAYVLKRHQRNLTLIDGEDYHSLTTHEHNIVLEDGAYGAYTKVRADAPIPEDQNLQIPRTVTMIDSPGLKIPVEHILLALAMNARGYIHEEKNSTIYFDAETHEIAEHICDIAEACNIEKVSEFVYPDNKIELSFVSPKWVNYLLEFDFQWATDATYVERMQILNEVDYWFRLRHPFAAFTKFGSRFHCNVNLIETMACITGLDTTKEKNSIPFRSKFGKDLPPSIIIHHSRIARKTFSTYKSRNMKIQGRDRPVACVQVPTGMILVRHYGRIFVSGNCDAIIVNQEMKQVAVSPTNGCKAFLPEWVQEFYGKKVVILFDSDTVGRNAVRSLLLPAFKGSVMSGKIPGLKVVWLFEEGDEANKDATDWFVKSGGSSKKLQEIVDTTEDYLFRSANMQQPKAKNVKSFTEIEASDYIGSRVSVPIYVYGENSETYHAVKNINVRTCQRRDIGKCQGRRNWDWSCSDQITVQDGERIQLACVGVSDSRLRNILREYICDRGKSPALDFDNTVRTTLRELFVHQIFDEKIGVESTNLVEKTVYNIGNDAVPIGRYQATGYVHSNPRTQVPTMLIDTLEKRDEDWQKFDLVKSKNYLEDIQAMDIMSIITDLSDNVTQIYSREELHLGVMLTLCSPQWINLPGEGRIRGWMSSVVIGDSGTGKSNCAERLLNHGGVGYRVSGMTSSRTGLTYSIDHDPTHGWRIKAGWMLKMNKQALIIDEAQDLPEEDIKTMADAMDTGKLSVARVENRTFEAMTRCIFLCNPKQMDRTANQRTMDSFLFGCQSLSDIFPQMMLRRLDLAMFAARFDIEDRSVLFQLKQNTVENIITSKHMRALIHYAWNLKPEQILISSETVVAIRKAALRLSDKFGQCTDLPIVCPEDYRKTITRIASSLAILDLSSKDGFKTIDVLPKHVAFSCQAFLEQMYSASNCRLDRYSDRYVSENVLDKDMQKKFYKELTINILPASPGAAKRILYMMKEIVAVGVNDNIKIPQREFYEHFSVDAKTIRRDMQWFIENKLVLSARGYKPTNKLVIFFNYIKDMDQQIEKVEDRLYSDK